MSYKTFGLGRWLLAIGLIFKASTAWSGDLRVYTAVEPENLLKYEKAFHKVHPDINIHWVRNSTGVMTARLLAEKDKPQADVVWGLAATSLLLLKNEQLLLPYQTKNAENLKPNFKDKDSKPTWFGMEAWVGALCVNQVEMKRLNLPVPKSWEDLGRSEYKGHIVMPNPASSGTGYLDVSAWIQMFGEERAWSYMDRLHKNIRFYSHSGSKPCILAAAGEVPIGVSFIYRGAKLKSKGAPIDVIVPEEGVGWEMEAMGILKTTKNLVDAQKLIDWSLTKEANQLYAEAFALVAHKDVRHDIPHYPDDIESKIIPFDLEWSAKERDRILNHWQLRYQSVAATLTK